MEKKSMILSACALLSLPLAAQKYEVSGVVPADVNVVYLQNLESRNPDSVVVADGKFKFAGEANGKIFAIVAAKGDSQLKQAPIILEGNVEVDLKNGKAGGNAENEGLSIWYAKMEPSQNALREIMTEYYSYSTSGAAVPDSVQTRINNAYEAESQKMYAVIKDCCLKNLQSKFPAYFLAQYATAMNRADVIEIAETGKPVYMEIPMMKRLQKMVDGWKKQMPGTMFTDLTLNNTNNEAHKLSEYIGKGKYILVDFWASWCGPCRKAMPSIKALYEKYKNKNFDIVGLSFDQDKTAWVNAIKQMEMPWIHLSDLKGWQSIAGSTYGINSIPATLLIGPDGKIIASGLHAEELDAKLSELLK